MQQKLAHERVARGAALMDQHKPGWEDRIRIPNLEMYSGASCILGQCYGAYSAGAEILFPNDFPEITQEQEAVNHGFQSDSKVGYNALHEEWVMQIMARRTAKVEAVYQELRYQELRSQEQATVVVEEELVGV